MKRNDYLHLLAIMMVALLSIGVTSCDDDDEKSSKIDEDPIEKKEELGKDGLKGYWIDNNGWADYGTGPQTKLFYLDGEGGGSFWPNVVESKTQKAYPNEWNVLIGSFLNTENGSKTIYYSGTPTPRAITYSVKGSSITVIDQYKDIYIINKSNYQRLTKQ